MEKKIGGIKYYYKTTLKLHYIKVPGQYDLEFVIVAPPSAQIVEIRK